MDRQSFGKTFVDPTTPLQGSFHCAFTALKALLVQVVDQQIRAPAGFKVAIITGMFGQHGVQDRQSGLFLTVGASCRRGHLEPFDSCLSIRFEPTADGVLMTPHGGGNGGHPLALIGEQDCQTAFCKVCGADTTCFFKGFALLRGQFKMDHQRALQRGVGVGLDQIEEPDSIDSLPFLQSLPSGRLVFYPP